MKGLSLEIEQALDTIIDGLNYNFFATGEAKKDDDLDKGEIETFVKELDPDKMKGIMESKTSSFKSAKKILDRWMSSPNAPSQEKIASYIQKVIDAGDSAIGTLRIALSVDIDFDELEPHKHDAAIKAKPVILEAIFDLNSSIVELRDKLESGDLSLSEKEFKIGFPERYAKGEFYPVGNYWKDWYNDRSDAIRICPFSTSGLMVTLEDLKIQLPVVPEDKSTILFSDLKKKEQYWRRQHVPPNITPENVDLWDDYIREEFRRRREGIWFMNNGEPVFLTGNHYFALQWCQMLDNGGYMDFRYAQLNMFYHLEACIIDNRSLGQLFLKSRRTGFTYVVLTIMLNQSTGKKNGKYGMTSKSGDDVDEMWMKFSYMFLSLPFFFRPVVKGKEDSPNELFFGKPSDNTKEAKKSRKMGLKDYLNTNIDKRPTKNDSYDSVKLDYYAGDEAFKWRKPNDYIVHLAMISPTMMPAGKVVGKAFIGSTMGSMAKGGDQGVEMIKGSMVKDRDKVTGKTSTALYFYFLAAQDNMEEFTDKYGKCWTEKPPRGTKNILGEKIEMGSIDYLLAIEEQKRGQSDKSLNEQLRTYPRNIEHAMRDEAEDSVFNITKLYEQIDHNNSLVDRDKYTVGNFDWEGGVEDSNVVFSPNPNGRFKVNWLPSKADGTEGLQNRVKEVNNQFSPLNQNCVYFGCDPFSLKSTVGKGSKGGIHGKTVFNPEGGAPSNKFVLEYLERPPDEYIFFEDVIKMVRFYGAPILIESNRIDLSRHMQQRGYRAFCMDRVDKHKSKLNPNEKAYGGQIMSGESILSSHLNTIGSWIQDYVGVYTDEVRAIRTIGEMGDMPFNETLKDWLKFNVSKRSEHDATISSGLAIMACRASDYLPKRVYRKKFSVGTMLKKYSNK